MSRVLEWLLILIIETHVGHNITRHYS